MQNPDKPSERVKGVSPDEPIPPHMQGEAKASNAQKLVAKASAKAEKDAVEPEEKAVTPSAPAVSRRHAK